MLQPSGPKLRLLIIDALGVGRGLKVVDEVGNVLVIGTRHRRAARLVRLGHLLQVGQVVGSELVDDARKQVLQLLRFGLPAHHIGVCRDGSLHLGVVEVHHHAVVLEEVDLLNGGDVVHAQALERVLKSLVVRGGSFVDGLLLPPDRALATRAHLRSHFGEFLRVHISLSALESGRPGTAIRASAPRAPDLKIETVAYPEQKNNFPLFFIKR
mmetsp:Transcript_3109/g.9817  ORF Transcript_3109/g.9817 Transcript_3109/m.9817 type:complete len:212 (-) Transcript_3109:2310-2945(-)